MTKHKTTLRIFFRTILNYLRVYWRQNRWHKLWILLGIALILWTGTLYGIARWYMWSKRGTPTVVGTSFIPAYAESLGLDAQQTMDALIDDVGVRHFRLVSYWDQIEPQPGVYDFSGLDWQFRKAEQAHAKISLSIGLRQPRWPECHEPKWIDTAQPESVWQPQLEKFMSAVIERYKTSPSLESYQLENEYFLKAFGQCKNFSRQRLVSEYALVKRLDPNHQVIVSRSNNALGTPIHAPIPDVIGVSIYKRTWSPYIKRNLEYPFPAWFYGSLAGIGKLTTGKDTMIHELQAEAWPPDGLSIPESTLAQQNETFDAARFRDRIEYGRETGMTEMYLWSGEYWHYRKMILHDPSLWDVAKDIFHGSDR